MLPGPKRALVLIAEQLGWLNWADERIVRGALGGASAKQVNGAIEISKACGPESPDPSTSQPGPVFAEEPLAFIEWVQAELQWIERQAEAGADQDLIADFSREAQAWIEHGLAGRQTLLSRTYISDLLELQDIADSMASGERQDNVANRA